MDTNREPPAGMMPPRRLDGDSARGEAEGLGTLISGLLKDLQDLVRAEVQLAKTELQENATAAGRAIAMIAGGALVGLVGFIFVMLAVTYGLNHWFPDWVSALIVGVVLALVALMLVMNGTSKLSAASLKPDQTIETLKEDQAWAKQQINSVKR